MFHNIVDHAGLMLLLLLCLIESRFKERLLGQILTLLLRFLSHAQEMMDATVVRLTTPSNGCIPMRSLMKPALSTELEDMTMVPNAQLKSNVRTAHQLKAAGTWTTIRSITPTNTERSVVNKL